eukprot:COSAG01_NODE_10399_length_2176_cov_4.675494_3_plen_55_part_00
MHAPARVVAGLTRPIIHRVPAAAVSSAVRKWIDVGVDLEANELACDMYRAQLRK